MHWKDLETPAASDAGRDPFAFDPVPVRARKDGWTAERQRKFVALLAAGCGPSEAAVAVGMTRQSAFVLRERAGAASFAAAWDAAVAFARRRRFAAHPKGVAQRAREGVLVPRFYRGRLVAVERRATSGGMMRLLAQLDGWAAKAEAVAAGAPSFDEILDLIAPRPPAPKRRRRSKSSRAALDARFGKSVEVDPMRRGVSSTPSTSAPPTPVEPSCISSSSRCRGFRASPIGAAPTGARPPLAPPPRHGEMS